MSAEADRGALGKAGDLDCADDPVPPFPATDVQIPFRPPV
jgi:hypothetical protein